MLHNQANDFSKSIIKILAVVVNMNNKDEYIIYNFNFKFFFSVYRLISKKNTQNFRSLDMFFLPTCILSLTRFWSNCVNYTLNYDLYTKSRFRC